MDLAENSASDSVKFQAYLEVHGFGLEKYIAHSLEIRDGMAIAQERPGHGI